MGIVAQLLDKYKESRSLASDNSLAGELGITRQTVSQWRAASAYPDEERIASIAQGAGEDAAGWLVAVRAERTTGAAAKAYRTLARQLGIAATICLAVYTSTQTTPAEARSFGHITNKLYIAHVMRGWCACYAWMAGRNEFLDPSTLKPKRNSLRRKLLPDNYLISLGHEKYRLARYRLVLRAARTNRHPMPLTGPPSA